MDFAGVQLIHASIFPALGGPAVTSGLRICRVLAGMAETALGHYASALDYLATARQEMVNIPGRSKAAKRRKALFAWATLVGAMILARAVDDPELSDEILSAVSESIGTL
jgi:hypothetical protein